MIVVADAAPLRYLIEIDCAAILRDLFGLVLVPASVARELQQSRTPDSVKIWMSDPPEWIQIRSAGRSDESLNYLGAGEREAIMLAQDTGADWLIVDDREGRRAATDRQIPVLGTLRVLDEAASLKLIEIAEVVAKLQQTTFYLSPEVLAWLLERDAARRR